MRRVQLTVSGSFRRHLDEVRRVCAELTSLGATVLSPRSTNVIGEVQEFVLLSGDPSRNVREVEDNHLRAIRQSAALVVVCPDGDIGLSTAFEIGYALACGVPVVSLSGPFADDFDGLSSPAPHIRTIADLGELVRSLTAAGEQEDAIIERIRTEIAERIR